MNTEQTTELQQRIAAIGAKERDDQWALRQEMAKRQQANDRAKLIERHRAQRIAQLKTQLDSLPQRIKQAQSAASDADELAVIWSAHLDALANNYAQRLHAERQGGRPIRLELGSPESTAYFFGSQIKKSLRQLALTANTRSFGQPLIDAESLAIELRDEEKRLKAELAELQLRG